MRSTSEMSTPQAQAAAARVADLRLERWYAARGLRLPADVQAEFTAMGVEAIAGDPSRAPDAVMDDLLAELDQTLGHIVSSEGRSQRGAARPSWFQRLRRPFSSARDEGPRTH